MVPPDFASIAREISELLARGEFDAAVGRCNSSRLTPEVLRRAVLEYPRKLVPPPREADALLSVVQVTVASLPTWSMKMLLRHPFGLFAQARLRLSDGGKERVRRGSMKNLILVTLLVGTGARGAEAIDHRQKAAPVRVLAFNVQFDSTRTAESLSAIAQLDADVACLEEVTTNLTRAFEKRFASKYPHRAFFPKPGTWGLGVASRWPISSARTFAASPSRMPALEAMVRTPSGPLRVVCVHLFPPAAKRRKNAGLRLAQAEHLVARYRRSSPVVVMGDFNETADDAGVKALLAAHFVDACSVKDAQCRATWPGPNSPWPAMAQIDLVLGRGVRFTSARVPDGGGSDHRPMTASFVLR